MNLPIDAFLSAISRCAEPVPGELAEALRRLPDPTETLSPWEAWILIGLAQHRARQYWVSDIIKTRLLGSPDDLASIGGLAHPRSFAQHGTVPGMPEWEYYFHGIGCCLTHRVDGDRIDVNFYDETAEYFDLFLYQNYLDSLRHPELPEHRLRQLYPTTKVIRVAIPNLLTDGALEPFHEDRLKPFRLSAKVLNRVDAITNFCEAWRHESRRIWLAALIGDWLAAHEAAKENPELQKLTASRAEQCRMLRREKLKRANGYEAFDALRGLAQLGNVDQEIEEALRATPSGLIVEALKIINEQDDPRWCRQVYELLLRINANGTLPEPLIWIQSLKFLLRHGYKTNKIVSLIPKTAIAHIGEGVMLALEHAPRHAILLIRRGLLNGSPTDRITVSAILAVIAKPWSTQELLCVLDESRDQDITVDVRAAILESGDREGIQIILEREPKYPNLPEAGSYITVQGESFGPFFTFREHAIRDSAMMIRYTMTQIHDRVFKLRDIVPPEPKSASWWKFW